MTNTPALNYVNSGLPGTLLEIPGGFIVHTTLKMLLAPDVSPEAKLAVHDDLKVYLQYIPAQVAKEVEEWAKRA